MSTHVAVTQSVLAWALQRADRSYEETVKKFPKLGDWMSGDALPSLRELEKFASFTHVSLGALIMPEPPDETLPIADMRTRDSKVIERPSGNLLDTIDRYQQFQDWYHDYAREQGAQKLPFLGSVSTQDNPHMIARRVRELLLLDRVNATSPDQWRRDIVKALEDVGVLVMMSGIVGNNTHRPLSTDEFRGFCLYDVLAPLIFVNLAGESYGAQNFTLVHEFAHLLAGHSALSGGDHLLGGTSEEAWCNRVAALALLPDDALAAFDAAQSLQDYRVAARRFGVSAEVALHRLYGARRINEERYYELLDAVRADYGGETHSSGGGNFYNTLTTRLGRPLATAIVTSTLEGRIGFTEGFRMIGSHKREVFDELARRLQVV
ncbi:MAG: ImmA/IrrE family metallo-endopeptidase [Actinomyces sp.]|nr:ImmA/IrrE family metallo-endopeptidase [Actinomyces sp.]